jgi:predicted porin
VPATVSLKLTTTGEILMQKKIIALALAGLASSAAFAQSNVTIYGRADMGYLSRSGDDGGSRNVDRRSEIASGNQAGSRIGFKGTEDLGNGLKALFQFEFGSTAMDTDSGMGNTRNAYVGLTGNFGTVVTGRLDGVRYGLFNKYDAFGGGNVANFTQMTAQVDRANSAIAYISPSWNGLNLTLAYSSHIGNSNPLGQGAQEGSGAALNALGQDVNGNDGDAVLNTIMVNYKNGPIELSADWERVSFEGGNVANAVARGHDDVTVWTIGGSYDFGVVKLSALYDNLQTDVNNAGVAAFGKGNDIDTWFVSASVPMGKFVGKFTYGETEDDNLASSKGKKFGIGADYNLSKRTNLYASYGSISNSRNARYEISPAANSDGTGYGVKGFDLGIAHKF